MPKVLRTVKEIEAWNEPGVYRIYDAPNLYVQVQWSLIATKDGGSRIRAASDPAPRDGYQRADGLWVTKSWWFRFQNEKVADSMGGGSLRSRKLTDAKEWAYQQRLLLSDGINPREHRDEKERDRVAAANRSKPFKECAAETIAAKRAEWRNAKHAAQWESTLRTYCYPDDAKDRVWRTKPVSEIDTDDVLAVLQPIWISKNTTASRLRGRIEEVLDWATVKKYRTGLNPARWKGHLAKLLAKPSKVRKVKHHAALPYKEVAAFLTALRQQPGVASRALEFIILTATRTAEAIGAKWSELDFDAKSWTIPAERLDADGERESGMKSGRMHRVPLTARALEILQAMRVEYPQSEYVFPSRDGKSPLSNMACLKVLERMSRTDLTVHGFRSTFRDWAGEETNFPRDVIEMSMAHRVAGKTEESYWRGDLYEKRRRLMEAWGGYCEKEPEQRRAGTVHSIESKRRATAGQ